MPSQVRNLLEVSDLEKKAILKHYGISEYEFEEMIEILQSWYEKTSLPQEGFAKEKLKVALLNCKMDLEKTKRSIEGYFRIRTTHSDFFDRLVPNTPEYAVAKSLSKTLVMPKLTRDLCRITIFRIDNPQASAPDGLIYEILAIMGIEFRIFSGDYFYSNILIIDLKDFGLRNLIKYTPDVCNTLVNCMTAINLRLKHIHFVNPPTIFEKVLLALKYFLPSQFHDKVRIHPNYDSLYEYIPKEYLPSNYGGTQSPIEQLQDKWCQMLESREEEFKKLRKLKLANLSSMNISQKSDKNFGMEGSFRKLALD